jgi:hypothetical protein
MSIQNSSNSVDPRPVVRSVQATVTGLSTGAGYTAGNQAGTQVAFTNALRTTGTGTVATATLIDKSNVLGAVDLHLFSQPVTPASENTAANFSDADMQYFIGTISFPAPIPFVNNRAATVPAVGLSVQAPGTTLYGYMVTLTTHASFSAANDVTINLVMQQY